jgi:hypothetical protein
LIFLIIYQRRCHHFGYKAPSPTCINQLVSSTCINQLVSSTCQQAAAAVCGSLSSKLTFVPFTFTCISLLCDSCHAGLVTSQTRERDRKRSDIFSYKIFIPYCRKIIFHEPCKSALSLLAGSLLRYLFRNYFHSVLTINLMGRCSFFSRVFVSTTRGGRTQLPVSLVVRRRNP